MQFTVTITGDTDMGSAITRPGNMNLPLYINELLERGWTHISVPFLTVERVRACYADWSRFFHDGMKEQFLQRDGGLDGYFPKGIETAKGYDEPDPKEFLTFAYDAFSLYPWGLLAHTLGKCL
jgi:hypothetical protein